MRKIIIAMMIAATALTASADIGEWNVGGQIVYAGKSERPGVGLHVKRNYSHAWRTALSGNYYFKKNGVSYFDINIEQHYTFELGERVRLYPLVGVSLGISHTGGYEQEIGGIKYSYDGDTEQRIGCNAGGGIDYLIGDHVLLNAEVKYQFMKDANQVFFVLGASYRF